MARYIIVENRWDTELGCGKYTAIEEAIPELKRVAEDYFGGEFRIDRTSGKVFAVGSLNPILRLKEIF